MRVQTIVQINLTKDRYAVPLCVVGSETMKCRVTWTCLLPKLAIQPVFAQHIMCVVPHTQTTLLYLLVPGTLTITLTLKLRTCRTYPYP